MNKTTHIWFLENKNNKWNTGKQCFFVEINFSRILPKRFTFIIQELPLLIHKFQIYTFFIIWPISFYKNFIKTILALYSEYISKWWKERPNDENLFALFSVMTLFETMVIKVSKFSFLSHWRLRKLKTTFRSRCLY